MKIKIIITTLAFLFLTTISFASSNVTPNTTTRATFLSVINNWYDAIQVREGVLVVKEAKVYPGGSLDWIMFTGKIANLNINYFRNGHWQQIPNCPFGNFNYGFKIFITSSPWDPSLPTCYLS
jgi:hypothetical protein